jgi:nucleotide-binding universal stress UspA family protein
MPLDPERSRIVVGVDGSPESRAAVRWASREASMRHVELTVAHASPTPVVASSAVLWPAPVPAEVATQQQEYAKALIEEAVEVASRAAHGVRVEQAVLDSAPVPMLVGLSKEAQLVVVGRRGGGRLHGIPLGSVSAGLLHHGHSPVAVIHIEADSPPHRGPAPVVVGIDGSAASELATAIAFDEASWRGVDLVALHAWCDSDVFGIHTLEWAAVEASAHETLAERLAGWQERYPDVTVHSVVVLDRAAQHLLEQAERAQLVVVGSHGRGGFAGMLLGSVGTAVAQAARAPVIVARRE